MVQQVQNAQVKYHQCFPFYAFYSCTRSHLTIQTNLLPPNRFICCTHFKWDGLWLCLGSIMVRKIYRFYMPHDKLSDKTTYLRFSQSLGWLRCCDECFVEAFTKPSCKMSTIFYGERRFWPFVTAQNRGQSMVNMLEHSILADAYNRCKNPMSTCWTVKCIKKKYRAILKMNEKHTHTREICTRTYSTQYIKQQAFSSCIYK